MQIQWHYERSTLITTVLSGFEAGLSNTITLFAPRRMGKTEFVLYDLIPAAGEKGYKTLYVSFWENPDDPVSSLIGAVDRAISGSSWLKRRKAPESRSIREVKVGGGVNPAGVVSGQAAVSFNDAAVPDSQSLSNLRSKFTRLLAIHPRVLLCLDEVQHLATKESFEPLVYFLRTLIDEHRERLFVVYTGSSRDGLRQLFSRRKAPLFRSTSQIDLPDLDAGFVQHILSAFQQATGRSLDLAGAMRAFVALNRVPYDFRALIETMILSGETDILAATDRYREVQIEESDYLSTWKSLKSVDRAVLVWLSREREGGLYQEGAKQFVADYVGMELADVSVHTIQNAVKRLRGEHICQVDQGVWDFEDSHFKTWVAENKDAD